MGRARGAAVAVIARVIVYDVVVKIRDLRRGISLAGMAVASLFIAFALRAALMPAQSDTFWHLRAGADILRTGEIPRVESYSFTAAGWPWRDHEWLWQPFAYGAYHLGGMPLLTLSSAVLAIGAVALSYRLTTGPLMTRFLLVAVGLPLSMAAWVTRPHLVTLAAVPLLMTWLVRERHWPIPLLFVVWANAHGGVALGGVLLTVATALAVLRWRVLRTPEDRRRAVALAAVLPLSGLACLLTPFGLGMISFLSDSMVRIRAVSIGEWQPAIPTAPFTAGFWVLALAFVAVLIRRRGVLRDGHASSWAAWVLVGGALTVLPLAFMAVRNIPPFLLLAVPAASRLLGPEAHVHVRLPWRKQTEVSTGADHPLINLGLVVTLAAAAAVFVAWSYRNRDPGLGWQPIDERALAAVRACDGPLYNHYDEGGYLIWFTPTKPVFVDGRQDPFPLEHILDALAVERGKAHYRPLFDRWGIRCVFLSVGSPTLAALDRDDGWVTRFRDDRWAVLSAVAR